MKCVSDPLFSVLMPTHNHAALIGYSIDSVLGQSFSSLELLIVGDGLSPDDSEAIERLASRDRRVRVLEFEKGERHGEAHRHTVLAQARGRMVCYCSDDDLLLPDHLQHMSELLAECDFCHPLPVYVNEFGVLGVAEGHLSIDVLKRRMLESRSYNFIALHGASHSMAFYRSLPHGWRPAPAGVPTDLWMWQQILSVPGCRVRSGSRPTMLHFPSPGRRSWDLRRRQLELEEWTRRVCRTGGELWLAARCLDHLSWAKSEQGEELRISREGGSGTR